MKWWYVNIKYEDKGSTIEVEESIEDDSAYGAFYTLKCKHDINPDKITYIWTDESTRNF